VIRRKADSDDHGTPTRRAPPSTSMIHADASSLCGLLRSVLYRRRFASTSASCPLLVEHLQDLAEVANVDDLQPGAARRRSSATIRRA